MSRASAISVINEIATGLPLQRTRRQEMKLRKIDHVGVIVHDLAAAREFFLALGFQSLGETDLKGDWVGRIIGLKNVKTTVVMLGTPEGDARLELVKFHKPVDEEAAQLPLSNALGIRHIALLVEDVEAAVASLKQRGAELMGEIYNYENIYKLCYIRGPEGIILELAEEIG